MKKAELLEILTKLDIKPSRKLGQNFLIDNNLLDAMVRLAAPGVGERVLEIGPGAGVLTERLLASGCELTAIELDHRLAGYLRERYGETPRFRLIEDDACKVDLQQIMGDQPFRCIANLPYSCSSQLLTGLASLENPPQEVFCLLQREMAERLTAMSGTKDYGVLTVRIGLRYQVSIAKIIAPEVFFPAPDVQSAYTRLRLLPEALPSALADLTSAVAGVAFSQRRKKTMKLLTKVYGEPGVTAAFRACGLADDVRGDNISVKQYIALSCVLQEYLP